MTATLTINHQCTRCPRVDSVPLSLKEAATLAAAGLPDKDVLKVHLGGENARSLKHTYLCEPCYTIVNKHLDQIFKELTQRSSVRGDNEDVEIEID